MMKNMILNMVLNRCGNGQSNSQIEVSINGLNMKLIKAYIVIGNKV